MRDSGARRGGRRVVTVDRDAAWCESARELVTGRYGSAGDSGLDGRSHLRLRLKSRRRRNARARVDLRSDVDRLAQILSCGELDGG